MNINRSIHEAAEKLARSDSKTLPKSSTKREKSKNEREAEWHPQGYGLHFCLHDRTYYEVCTNCRRTKKDAENNLNYL